MVKTIYCSVGGVDWNRIHSPGVVFNKSNITGEMLYKYKE